MNASSLTMKDRIRARDGDLCWLCTRPLDFAAVPNSKKAPTVEHLHALSRGGSKGIDNVVLCHKSCNKHLDDRPRADKESMRVKWHANAAKVAAKASVKAPQAAPPAPTDRAPTLPAAALKPVRPAPSERARAVPPRTVASTETTLAAWRRWALGSTGAALFLAGLVAGLLID
jgi:hypothetical protein